LSELHVHAVQAAEFILQGNKHFSEDSLCVFCSRSGDTQEIVNAIQFCNVAGATTLAFACHADTPVCTESKHHFVSFAEDDHLAECFYLQLYAFLFRILMQRGDFPKYITFVEQIRQIAPYLVKAKEQTEAMAVSLAVKHKNTDYHMVVGSGAVWGEAYDYAMCILEEMQWLKTKSIHAGEYFHGTLELTDEDTSMLLLYGEDSTRPLMDRVYNFASRITKNIAIFDTKRVELPLDKDFRPFLSPIVIYSMLERFSCHLEKERKHPLEQRRYYRKERY
jgi:fructoselysine-6-phosphate deglycase